MIGTLAACAMRFVAADIRIDDGEQLDVEAAGKRHRVDILQRRPAPGRQARVPSVKAQHNLTGERLRKGRQEIRILDRCRPRDDLAYAGVEVRPGGLEVAYATSHLHGHIACGLGNPTD